MRVIIVTCLLFFISEGFVNASDTKQITGTVTGIDIRNSEIMVKKGDKEVIIKIEKDTRIRKCIEKDSIRDITIGSEVTIKYEDGLDNKANSVLIK